MNLEYEKEFDEFQSKIIKYALYKRRTRSEILQKINEVKENYKLESTEKFEEFKKRVLENLISFGYIDEAKYCYDYIRDAINSKTCSLFELTLKLLKKKIKKECIEDTFLKIEDEENINTNNTNKNIDILNDFEKRNITKLLKARKSKTYFQNYTYLKNKGFRNTNILEILKKDNIQ